jgi:hypothetical protein
MATAVAGPLWSPILKHHVDITMAERVEWSASSHRQWFAEHDDLVQAVLLAHNAGRTAKGAPCTLATLPKVSNHDPCCRRAVHVMACLGPANRWWLPLLRGSGPTTDRAF